MKLFISYSHADKDFVVKLYNTLTYSNLEVFIDEKDIKIGDNILEKIEKGIEESAGLLYVISKYSVKSTWVKEELSMARVKSITQRGIYTIYPLLVDDVELPVSISQLKYVQNPGKSHTESGLCRTPNPDHAAQCGVRKALVLGLYLRCSAWSGQL
ncbi:MAG TPA: toll/interleukin-1 receptor domain-containing protein [Pyrinomonadaceae bacterium]|nr:toll/interleukin-1 receptor domain-containing protein [Pyrinomonadaceae bacterium]